MASEGTASRDSAAFEARARITSRRKEGRGGYIPVPWEHTTRGRRDRGYVYFREPPKGVVRRTPLPGTSVNKLRVYEEQPLNIRRMAYLLTLLAAASLRDECCYCANAKPTY